MFTGELIEVAHDHADFFKARGCTASRAVSSHVFTRTCNMNGALSGCRRGKSASNGPGSKKRRGWGCGGVKLNHAFKKIYIKNCLFVLRIVKPGKAGGFHQLAHLCKGDFIIYTRHKREEDSPF